MIFTAIVTVGPASLNQKLRDINKMGNCIFRINGAHLNGEAATDCIKQIRGLVSDAAIMIDLPGNKVRTANLNSPIQLRSQKVFRLPSDNINFSQFGKFLKVGDIVYANDSIYKLEVVEIREDAILLLSHSDGELCTNKGIHLQGISEKLPFLFKRDLELIDVAVREKTSCISLSYVRNEADIIEAKNLLSNKGGELIEVFAKVETRSAVENLGHILHNVSAINVDRGDLSSDIGLLKLPRTQERIIESGLRAHRKVFLATQFLKSMEHNPLPYIAELIDLHRTIKSGISGIQLSEETAIGKYPEKCVQLVFDCFKNSFNV